MNNKVSDSGQWRYTPSGSDIASGEVVDLTTQIGIANDIILDGEEGVLVLDGIFTLAKDDSLVIAFGDKVYWDVTLSEIDKTATDQTYAGLAAKAAAETATTVQVDINRHSQDEV